MDWFITEGFLLFILVFVAAIYLRLQARKKRSIEVLLSIAKEELQKNQAFYDSIFENTRECIKVLDLDCKLNFMNGGGQKLLEICDFASIKGANWLEFWKGKDKESAITAIEAARLGGIGQFTGYFPTVETQTPKWFEVVITTMRDRQGLPVEFLVVSRDVTDRRAVEESIRSSENQLKTLAESIPQIVWTSTPDGNLDYYNQRWFDYTGMTLEQTKGWGWGPVLHPDDLQNCVNRWNHAFKTGEPYEVEYRFKRAVDGVYRWHLGRAMPVRDSLGTIVKWFGTCTDIHEQKIISDERAIHAAHELAIIEVNRSKEFLDQIIENIPAMILIKDAKDLKFVRLNKAGEEFIGYTQAEILGKSDYDFLPKDQADFLVSKDRAVLSSGGMIDIKEHQVQTKNIGERILRTKKMALIGPDGVQYLLGISEDITEHKKSEETFRQLNSELETKVAERTQELSMVAETIPHLVWIISGDGISLYFNKRWIEYTGTSLDKPSSWEDIIHLEDIPVSKSAWEKSMQTGDGYSVEYRIRRTDGIFRWHLTRALPIMDANSKIVKWFGTCTDIHDQKEVQFTLTQTQAELEATASKFKQVVSSSLFGVIFWNSRCDITEANEAFLKMLGYDREDLENGKLNWRELTPPEHRAKDEKTLVELAEKGVCTPYEKEYFHKDGSRIPIIVGTALFAGQQDNGICFVVDITERKLSEGRLNTAVIEAPFPIMLHTEDGETQLVSKAWTEYSGYTIQDIPTISDWTEKAYGEKSGMLKSYIDDLFKLKAKVHNGEFTITSKSGEKRIWDLFTAPLGHLPDGRRLLISSAADVTDRVLAQESLVESESQFRTLANSMPHLAWMGLPDGSNYWYNQGWYDYTGTGEGEMDGSRWVSLHDPEILPKVLEKWSEALRVGSPFEMEFPLLGKNGTFRWFLTRVTPVRNKAGQISKWFGTATDVNEQRQLLSSVQTQKDRLQRLVSASVIAVAFSNREGKVVEANDAFLELSGYSKADLEEGKINRKVQNAEELSEVSSRALEAFTETGRCDPFEKVFTRKDGTKVPILIGFSDLGNDRNDIVTWMMNLTQLKQAELQKSLLEVREKSALESTKMKSEFLAIMSHEIRTPINGVIGMTSLLLDTQLNTEQRDYGETIRSSADTLLTLVNDILDISKAEAGKIDLEIINFDLEHVIVDIERTLGLSAKKKGIKLLKSVSTDLPAYLKGDPTRLRQVLANLVNNAIKFTSQGSVTIEVNSETQNRDQVRLRFEVTDTGIGIPVESLSRMFQSFSQADASTTRKFGGTGLGLSISKHLVTLMGGEIGVKSTAGLGSAFWFTIPFEMGSQLLGEASTSDDASVGVQRKLRILIAEDNSVNQFIAIKMFEKLGHTAVAVANGNEAFDALRTIPYDLVFMDCQMPELDGYATTKMIRNAKTLECNNIPIIAMTANAMSGDREKCIGAGMNDYVSKPMKLKDLALAIERNVVRKLKAA